jgi:Mn2+/Fe2+ NRAMP family transporter
MNLDKVEQITFPEPDAVLTEKPSIKKYLRYPLFFGPGAVVASLTIGQGQLIIGPQIGAWAGFALLWLITINIGSYIIAYTSCRFTMLSGIGIMDLFAIKTKKGWLNWLFIGIMLIFIPIFTATIITSLGQALEWIFGFGHYLIWGISFCLLAGVLVLAGRYKSLEITQTFFIAVLAIGAVISVISIKPDVLEILPNFFSIGQNVPANYPAWVVTDYPSVTKTPIPLIMLGYLGTLTITIITLKITYLPNNAEEVKKSRILLKPIVIDLALAFVIVSIVSASYMIAGSSLLGSRHVLPSDAKLVQSQLIIFTYMADWLKPLFQVSVVFALFGTVYAGFEAASRMLYETSKNISMRVGDIQYKRFMGYLLLYILVIGVPLSILIYRGVSVILMLSITLLFIGVIGVIIYGIGVIYMSQRVLPEEYRLGKIGLAASILSVVLMSIPLLFLFI